MQDGQEGEEGRGRLQLQPAGVTQHQKRAIGKRCEETGEQKQAERLADKSEMGKREKERQRQREMERDKDISSLKVVQLNATLNRHQNLNILPIEKLSISTALRFDKLLQ